MADLSFPARLARLRDRDDYRRAWAAACPAMSPWMVNCLARNHVSPDDAATMSDQDLLSLRMVGVGILGEVRACVPLMADPCPNWVGESVPAGVPDA